MKLKRVIKRFMILALCGLGLLVILIGLSHFFSPSNNKGFLDDTQRDAQAICAEPENTIDCIVIGDSEPKSAITPLHMYHQNGFTSYACATYNQSPQISYSVLRKALESQQPQVVIIETDALYSTKYTFSDCVMQCIKDVLPIFRDHDRWKQLVAGDFPKEGDSWKPASAKGYYVNTTQKPANSQHWMDPTDQVNEPSPVAQFFLSAMIRYCRDRGITPVLVSVPSTKNMTDARHNGLQELANELGVDYIDLNEGDTRVDIQWDTESRDGGDHLNYAGAVRNSLQLAAILDSRYDLPDHRGNPLYQSWEEEYQQFVEQYPVP